MNNEHYRIFMIPEPSSNKTAVLHIIYLQKALRKSIKTARNSI